MGFRAEWIEDESRLHAISEEWDQLAAGDGSPFSLHRWYVAWWDAFGAPGELATLALWDGPALAGILPMRRTGAALRLLANSHTPAARPLHASESALEALASEAFGSGSRWLFPRLPADDRCSRTLVDAARNEGLLALVEPDQASPFVALEGTWEDYRARMKRNWSSAERKARKMEREHDARFTIVEPPSDLDAQLERGFEVEASGWKGQAGTAITSDPATERFYRSIAREFAATGELALSELLLDGRCVAFDLCLLHRGRLHLLKTGFDERFRSLSPGLVMRQLIVRRCFELGLETHELLGDDSEWKRRFSTGVRRHVALRVMRRTPAGVARYAYRRHSRPALRSVYRSLRRHSRG